MMELKRDEIVKSLECCTSIGGCKKCPCSINGKPKDNGDCGKEMLIDALSLIKELTAENKLLNVELGNANPEILMLIEDKKELTEKNERLGDTAYRLECEVHRERADTVRKMRALIENESSWFVTQSNGIVTSRTYQLTEDKLDQIAKEIIEGETK